MLLSPSCPMDSWTTIQRKWFSVPSWEWFLVLLRDPTCRPRRTWTWLPLEIPETSFAVASRPDTFDSATCRRPRWSCTADQHVARNGICKPGMYLEPCELWMRTSACPPSRCPRSWEIEPYTRWLPAWPRWTERRSSTEPRQHLSTARRTPDTFLPKSRWQHL